jgi:hypothetical protein
MLRPMFWALVCLVAGALLNLFIRGATWPRIEWTAGYVIGCLTMFGTFVVVYCAVGIWKREGVREATEDALRRRGFVPYVKKETQH